MKIICENLQTGTDSHHTFPADSQHHVPSPNYGYHISCPAGNINKKRREKTRLKLWNIESVTLIRNHFFALTRPYPAMPFRKNSSRTSQPLINCRTSFRVKSTMLLLPPA